MMSEAIYNKDFRDRLAPLWLALDSFPFGCYLSAMQALSAGVPLLTFPGRTPGGRGAATILNGAGMKELILPDQSAMESKAIALLREPSELIRLRRVLPDVMRGSLFNDPIETAKVYEAALDQVLSAPVRDLRSLAASNDH